MNRFLRHLAALALNGCIDCERQAANVFDYALRRRVLAPCEPQGVSEMCGCTRAIAPVLARVIHAAVAVPVLLRR